jgi:hypothetical protein
MKFSRKISAIEGDLDAIIVNLTPIATPKWRTLKILRLTQNLH